MNMQIPAGLIPEWKRRRERMKLGFGKIRDALKGGSRKALAEGKKEQVEGEKAGRERRNPEDKK